MIVLFALSRVLEMAEEARQTGVRNSDLQFSGQRIGGALPRSLLPAFLRSTVIAVLIGILPGVGGNVAAFLSYNAVKRTSKAGDSYGAGTPKGVAAAESANHPTKGPA